MIRAWKRVGSWRTGGGVFIGTPHRCRWYKVGMWIGLILFLVIMIGGQ